ncbi:hypothetical protein HDU83_007352 [Entophlyctis luteolus]|nr:hypothetical protein HDU83_007352 [Entophlyctis luteolus]
MGFGRTTIATVGLSAIVLSAALVLGASVVASVAAAPRFAFAAATATSTNHDRHISSVFSPLQHNLQFLHHQQQQHVQYQYPGSDIASVIGTMVGGFAVVLQCAVALNGILVLVLLNIK